MICEITVLDYGVGNLFSVCRALEHCGAKVTLVSDPDQVTKATKIFLPGVGAFKDGMDLLKANGMDQAIKIAVAKGSILFGVCLGMQFLLDSSDEFGTYNGLGLIPGKVIAVPDFNPDGIQMKVPHVGWNGLVPSKGRKDWTGTILDSVPLNTSMYFVHSFMAAPENPDHLLADCMYGGNRIGAFINRDNVFGAQFHPEKSGEAGLSLLRRFVKYL